MRKGYRGSMTIEAAYLVPLVLLVFGVVLTLLFCFHDKNVLLGTAHETAAYGSGKADVGQEELVRYFQKRINGRLLLFTVTEPEVVLENKETKVACIARKKKLAIEVNCVVKQTNPEDYIRSIRKLKKIGEGKE